LILPILKVRIYNRSGDQEALAEMQVFLFLQFWLKADLGGIPAEWLKNDIPPKDHWPTRT